MIQIQPKYAHKDEWLELAKEETLRFEVLEFSSIHLNTDVPKEVMDWYKETNLVSSIHGAFIDVYPMSINFDINEASRRRCEESMAQADELGISNVVFHSTALPFCRDGLEDIWARDAAEYYEYLAKKHNKNIFIENFNDVDYIPMLHMMRNISDERVGICLDVAHANFSRIPVKKWFEELGEYIGYLHLSDNMGDWDDHIVIGEGNTDLDIADKWWQRSGKDIPITLELKTPENVRKSIQYLRSRGLFGF